MKLVVALVCLVATASCGGPAFNWLQHGRDWPGDFPLSDCGGDQQSPIDIALINARLTGAPQIRSFGARLEERPLDYDVNTARLDLSVSIVADTFDEIFMLGGTVFEPWTLEDVVFHAPSEHTFEGLRFPLEAQFVHDSGFGQFSIVGYMFRIQSFSANFIATLAQAIRAGDDTALLDLRLPITVGTFFHYRGSFTTPPCDERVDWHVYQSAIPITEEDLDTIRDAMTQFNFRDTQDLGERLIGVSDGCGLGSGHFAFNSRGRPCSAGHHTRAAHWESTPYAEHLHVQQRVVAAMQGEPELTETAAVFADILEYNRRAVVDFSVDEEGGYKYSHTFPEIKDAKARSRAEELANVFAHATVNMETLDYQRFDEEAAFNFNTSGLSF